MRTRLNLIAGLGLAAYFAALVAGTVVLARVLGVGGDGLHFNIQRWETENVVGHLLYEVRSAFTSDPGDSADDEVLIGYFEVNREIEAHRATLAADADSETAEVEKALDAALDQRSEMESRVERILEERIAAAIRSLDIPAGLPIFSDFAPVWPPVAVELGEPPRVLAVSPRDRIDLVQSDLLKPDLTLAELLQAEDEHDTESFSALVEDTGGVGTYPSNIRHRESYENMLEVVAHEWTHQYLAFYPLGFNYFDNNELRTLNETVANVIGEEIGRQAAAMFPLDDGDNPSPPASIDFRATMRALRLEVDALLAAGQVEKAEQRMEEVRQELADGGVFIRKINQAYFAFHGSYGDAPQSSSPLGPKVADLRGSVASLRDFLRLVQTITSEEELDAALAGVD
jgi:hypothetical protein